MARRDQNNTMRNGTAVAALRRTSAGPMKHRLAPRGNARSVAEAEALNDYEDQEDLDEAENSPNAASFYSCRT
jgi:hypothetical protein